VAGRLAQVVNGVQMPVQRSLAIGDALFTLSYRGLQESRLDNLATVGFTAFCASLMRA
jgi:hypothetical protein